jgi:acetyl-CoA acetyltransferase
MGDPIAIVGAARTPLGGFQGDLSDVPAPKLGAAAIAAALARAKVAAEDVDEVIMGCVLPAGLGQAPARQAALGAGLPQRVPCATLNKVCGAMIGHDLLVADSGNVVVAGGMESRGLLVRLQGHAPIVTGGASGLGAATARQIEGQIGQDVYAVSKARVLGLTLSAAREFAGIGIRVCAIALRCCSVFLSRSRQSLALVFRFHLALANSRGSPSSYPTSSTTPC